MDGDYPRLGCAGVVKKGDRILLGTRNKEPHKGRVILPGGGVEYMEPIEETLRREIREEAGIEVEVGGLIDIYEIINEDRGEHRVIAYRWADHVSGEPEGSDDLASPEFHTRDRVESMVDEGKTTPLVSDVLRDIGWA